MAWSSLIMFLFRMLARRFGPFGAATLALVRGDVLSLVGNETLPTIEGPDQLKQLIVDYLTTKIGKAVPNVLANRIISRVVAGVTDDLIDAIWNWLFGNNVVAQPLSVFRQPAVVEAPYATMEDVAADELWQAAYDALVTV